MMTMAHLEPWQQADREFACERATTSLRCRTASNGAHTYVMQCTRCGDATHALKKASLSAQARMAALPFDEAKRDDWTRQRRDRQAQLTHARDRAWWHRYNAYLQTPEWFARRQKVMKRARGICEGCAERPATQVHHLTYRRVTQEMLFDLVALCHQCHEAIHDEEDRSRARPQG
jgi:hypothetical protein